MRKKNIFNLFPVESWEKKVERKIIQNNKKKLYFSTKLKKCNVKHMF